MKRTITKVAMSVALTGSVCGLWGCSGSKDEPTPKSEIYGVVTDKATGEPLSAAGVELSPNGLRTVTGSEGQFEFTNLEKGRYFITVSKTGYKDQTSNEIQVKMGATTKCDFQLELLPPALRVVDDNRKDISNLSFGKEEADVSRSFNIFNDGAEKLEWEITVSVPWITLSKATGSLNPAGVQSIVLTIDRSLLTSTQEATTIHVTSNNGSREIRVTVSSDERWKPELNTLAVTDITLSTAVFNAEMLDFGQPAYTERGFVYSKNSMPTIETTIYKLTEPVNDNAKYSHLATQLEADVTYYVRAYAISPIGVAYSTNEVSFAPRKSMPKVSTDAVSNLNFEGKRVTLNGTIISVGEPAYTERGFVYGTSRNPTVEDDTKKTASGRGSGAFSANVTDLSQSETYYVRAYASSEVGTAYGEEISFELRATDYVVFATEGLMVQKEDIEPGMGYVLAAGACEDSRVGGFSDWRLPTRTELLLIYKWKQDGKLTGLSNDRYWAGDGNVIYYYFIDMKTGYIGYYSSGGYRCRVRAVRTIE